MNTDLTFPRPVPPSACLAAADDRVLGCGDAFAAGLVPYRAGELHPIGAAMLRNGGPVSMLELASELHMFATGQVASDPRHLIQAMLTTSQFGDILTSTARGIAAARLGGSELFELLARCCQDVEVTNFNAESFSIVDLDSQEMPAATTGDDFWPIMPRILGEAVRVFTRPVRLVLTEQVLLADDRGFIKAAIAGYIDGCHRAEQRHLASLLHANPNLSADGEPLFSEAAGNDKEVGFELALDTLEYLLRTTPTEAGHPANARLATILTPPAWEGPINAALAAKRPPEARPRVLANVYAPSVMRLYGFGDPDYFPAIARARLRGSSRDAVNFPNIAPGAWLDRTTGKLHHVPGISLEATHSVGIWPVSRVGVVRVRIEGEQ